MLIATQLTKRYGELCALDALDLVIGAGEVFALLGANGAGKTTTINLFLNFVTPTMGTAMVDGIDVVKHPVESKRYLSYIPENVQLYPNLTAYENLQYFARLAVGDGISHEEIVLALRQVGLQDEAIHRRVRTYSKGMRQKVGIALAMVRNTKALLLDEPTSGLDPQASNEFSQLLLMLRERGAAILMATHDLFRAKETATRVGIMKHGSLVQILHTQDLAHVDLERIYLDHMRS